MLRLIFVDEGECTKGGQIVARDGCLDGMVDYAFQTTQCRGRSYRMSPLLREYICQSVR
jgi:hypothetical protein